MIPELRISSGYGLDNNRFVLCISGISRPRPILNLYKNGELLLSDNTTEEYNISSSTTQPYRDLVEVESILTLSSKWYKESDVFVCDANYGTGHTPATLICTLSKPGM